MKSRQQVTRLSSLLFIVALMYGCGKHAVNGKYDIASTEYEQLTEQYLGHVSNFEWEDSYAFLSDDVEFKLPDGDAATRTVFKGLDEVKGFWNSYVKNSGNDRASFADFVHLPVQVNQMVDHIDATGVFNLCYFSAELSYGSEKANVRMHWIFHFNAEKKIDGIFTYYDRTPIIAAAKRNFLASGYTPGQADKDMIVQLIKIKSRLPEEALLRTARERASNFRALPGLLQKYYLRLSEPGYYEGVYVWDSKESMQAFTGSDLAATISQAYQTVGAPNVETSEVLFQLRD